MAGAAGGGGCRAATAFRVRCLPGRDLEEESVEAGWTLAIGPQSRPASSAADRRLVATIAAFSSLPARSTIMEPSGGDDGLPPREFKTSQRHGALIATFVALAGHPGLDQADQRRHPPTRGVPVLRSVCVDLDQHHARVVRALWQPGLDERVP
jgi:hypothetical protein